MKLSDLSPADGARKNRKRIGRGVASGSGKTAGRGNKGHNQRSGGGVRPGFEGGQMPLHRRLPKRGFTNIFRKEIAIVNVKDLSRFEADTVVDKEALINAGLVKGKIDGIKLLGNGSIDRSLTVHLNKFSESARKKIEEAGGKVEVVS